jgi:hypothetical protein
MTKASQYIAGMQNVEREIIVGVRERGLPISAQNFKWLGGAQIELTLRTTTSLEVKIGTKTVSIDFTRKELEDCAKAVEPFDARAKVAMVISTLAQK